MGGKNGHGRAEDQRDARFGAEKDCLHAPQLPPWRGRGGRGDGGKAHGPCAGEGIQDIGDAGCQQEKLCLRHSRGGGAGSEKGGQGGGGEVHRHDPRQRDQRHHRLHPRRMLTGGHEKAFPRRARATGKGVILLFTSHGAPISTGRSTPA